MLRYLCRVRFQRVKNAFHCAMRPVALFPVSTYGKKNNKRSRGQQFQSRLYFPPKSFTMPNYNRDRSGAVHQILDCLTPVCVGNEQASCTTETEIVSRTTDSNDGPHLGEHSSETLFVAALPQVNGTLICVFSMPLRIPTPPPLPCLSCILTSLNAIRCWFWQGQMPSQASQANRAIHENAAKPLFSKDFRKAVHSTVGDVVQLVRTLPCRWLESPTVTAQFPPPLQNITRTNIYKGSLGPFSADRKGLKRPLQRKGRFSAR